MLEFKSVINGCKNNTVKCKEMIYKSFYGYLMAIALRYVNNRFEAEELVNDTFIKIFDSIHQFNIHDDEAIAERLFKAWISKIVSRKAIDFLRTRKIFSSIDDMVEGGEPITHLNVITELNVKDILKLLDNLPSLHKIIFNLYEIEGYTHQEISKLLNIPESSSRVYLTRSKEKLRALYAQTQINKYETN